MPTDTLPHDRPWAGKAEKIYIQAAVLQFTEAAESYKQFHVLNN